MRKFPGWRAALAAAAVAGLAVPAALTATTASAATQGGEHHRHLAPELVTITVSTDNPDGTVNAYGPVRGQDGTDKQVSGNQDILVFDQGTVNVWHKATANSQDVDSRSCTATFTEDGTWKFKGGTGKYEEAAGSGTYHAAGFLVFKQRHHGDSKSSDHGGRCDTRSDPEFQTVTITATGRASNGHRRHD